MANPFSLTPDFSWVDQGADEGALVRAAAEVAAARMKQSAKPAAGRQGGAITAGLEHLGTDVYNAAARPSRIINELVGVPPGALTSGLVPRVDQAVPEVAFDLMGLGSMLASPASTAASVGSTAIRRPYVGPPDEAMMAVHNTRASRLAKADELGGFAVPSVAVVKPAHGFDSFGDVSLVGAPELVKPGRANPVFASDVYSPRFPALNDEGDKIFRGFTDLGNRRYAPLTLDNLVREMKGNVRGGESFNYGAGNVRAGVTPQFGSLREIQDARGKIVPRDEFEAMKSATNNELIDLAYKFHPYSKYSGNGFQHTADFSSMLGEYRGNMSKVAEHYKNLPPELIDEARAFMGKLRDMPTQYFEAKPQRAVGINEFKGAVVPEAEMAAVAPILERHGIKRIEQYGGGVNDPSRTAALNKFPDLLFSNAADKRVAGVAAAGEAQPLSLAPQPGIRAYHGSPHDFDRFDLSKIGTGEGAQSYGHGLYFAENEGVARSYKEALSKTARGNQHSSEFIADSFLRAHDNDRAASIALLRARADGRPKHLQALGLLERGWEPPKGKMYEVNINAKPEQFLDWDKPLAQQPGSVVDPLVGLAGKHGLMDPRERGSMQSILYDLGHAKVTGSPANATAAMREAGIPGIKYLDQGSRGAATLAGKPDAIAQAKYKDQWDALVADRRKAAGDMGRGDTSTVDTRMDALHKRMMDETIARDPNAGRTSNYVLFDDKLVDILRKYALPGAIGAGGFGSLTPIGDQ